MDSLSAGTVSPICWNGISYLLERYQARGFRGLLAFLAKCRRCGPQSRVKFLERLDKYLTRADDRALFNLPQLQGASLQAERGQGRVSGEANP